MFKQSSNEAFIEKVSSLCMYIEHENIWISAVVLNKDYAVTVLHIVPECYRQLGFLVILCDTRQQMHKAHIHGLNNKSDYVVFKKDDGVFDDAPDMVAPETLDKYIVVGFAFGEKKPSICAGHVSSLSTGSRGFFYGDSGDLPGFNGGGVFYSKNGALLGIARGSDWEGKETKQYGDVLEMISAQLIAHDIEIFNDQPFSV
uniref:Uncharacterized protein n=1 Tax=Acrobeloides nanus TaxID=290746 RepID=A0A914DR08_9BILA